MKAKRLAASIFVIALTVLLGFVFLGLSGCGNSTKTKTIKTDINKADGTTVIEKEDLSIAYTTDAQKSVKLPDGYPKDSFPVYENAYIMAVQSFDKSYVLVCYCLESVDEVASFYRNVFKDSQVISLTEMADEYTIFGEKEGYTFTVCVINNTEEDEELKDYPTSLAISLVANPD